MLLDRRQKNKPGKALHRLNRDITSREIRLIDADGEQAGVVSREAALDAAAEAELDLVEISPNAEPPVCRIMDYGKFLFQQKKQKAEAKKKQKQVHIKEVKIRPTTEEGDFQVKTRKARGFLEGGDKVKVSMRFRGREMTHQEIGLALLQRMQTELEEVGTPELMPRLEGRQMVMVLAPKKSK